MAHTVGSAGAGSDNGHTGTVDAALATAHGGRPATWHARRFGPHAVNLLAAAIIRAWRAGGDVAGLAAWAAPIEEALAGHHRGNAEARADLADAGEDHFQALYRANPCEETARALLRARAADRLASLEHDQQIATLYGLTL